MKPQREQNVGTVERWVRIVGGSLAAIVGLALLLAGPASLLWGVAYLVLALLGLDFTVIGITGYCPLYRRLSWTTAHPGQHAR